MSDVGNPRDHLANERTHLAWMRTALTVIVLGPAIARFGDQGNVSGGSMLAGPMLLVAGTGVVVYGSYRYRVIARELTGGTFVTAPFDARSDCCRGRTDRRDVRRAHRAASV